jgi:C-terminal processing protease CtpA/Prc
MGIKPKTLTIFGLFVTLALVLEVRSVEIPPNLLSSLESLEFRQREAADRELLKWGRERPAEAMNELLRQSRTAEDPEVRERCLGILRSLVNDEYLKEGEGYMGIRMEDLVVTVAGDTKPRNAIRVVQVVPNSAAELAGLKADDQIISMNGDEWREGPVSAKLTEKIRTFKPNTKVSFKVMRAEKLLAIVVTLGRRPVFADNVFMNGQIPDLEAMERSAKEAYFRRWLSERKSKD